MDNRLKVMGGVGLGAGLLFLLDTPGGRRRLRQVGDRLATLAAGPEDVLEGTDAVDELAADEPQWTPAARLLVSAAGGGLAFYGAKRRGRIGAALGSVGLGLLVRGLTDLTLRRIAGVAPEEPEREVSRAIHVDAAPETVFGLFVDYDQFPQLFARVREVADLGEGRTRWTVEDPSAGAVEWDAVLTRFETERELAWRTAGDPDRGQRLQALFAPDAEGGTRVELRLARERRAPESGEDAPSLFGTDVERQIEDVLVRVKRQAESQAL
jgi:uncharacterized membrane protein